MVHRHGTVETQAEGYTTAGQSWTSLWGMQQLWDFSPGFKKERKISCLGQTEEVEAVPDRASL